MALLRQRIERWRASSATAAIQGQNVQSLNAFLQIGSGWILHSDD
jgi:hypothetical protein